MLPVGVVFDDRKKEEYLHCMGKFSGQCSAFIFSLVIALVSGNKIQTFNIEVKFNCNWESLSSPGALMKIAFKIHPEIIKNKINACFWQILGIVTTM